MLVCVCDLLSLLLRIEVKFVTFSLLHFRSFLNEIIGNSFFDWSGCLWRRLWRRASVPFHDAWLQAVRQSYRSFLPRQSMSEQVAVSHAGNLAGYFSDPTVYR